MAHIVARRSLCARSKVGALIVDAQNHIVGLGYNGPPAGFTHGTLPCDTWCSRATAPTLSPEYDDCPTIHAESNALMNSDRSRREGGTIFVTGHVCFGCAKLIAGSGLAHVVVDAERPDLHRNPKASYEFLRSCGIEVDLRNLVMEVR